MVVGAEVYDKSELSSDLYAVKAEAAGQGLGRSLIRFWDWSCSKKK